MSTGVSPAFSSALSTRRVPRYKLNVPLALTVLRSGIPTLIPGNMTEIGEGGLGVAPASQLLVGESVRVEFLVPQISSPVRATAVVRYRHQQSFGLQFLRLPVEQQSIVRYWTRHQGEVLLTPEDANAKEAETQAQPRPDGEATPRKFILPLILRFALPIALTLAALGWWHWQQGWTELEARLPAKGTEVAQPELRVPGDVMEQRVSYRVMPEYPERARQAGVQGTVLLEVVVSATGAVMQVNPISGSEQLTQAAVDAVRWWRYQPYSENGHAAAVETTVAVNFRLTK